MNRHSLTASLVFTIIAGAHGACGPKGDDTKADPVPGGQTPDGGSGDATTGSDGGGGLPSVAAQIAAGESHTCAILKGGRVKCWGKDSAGQLGQALGSAGGSGTDRLDPKPLAPIDLGGGRATALALGREHSCALLDDGGVKCWGNNSVGGALGIGGSFSSAGFDKDSMGAALPKVDLGRKAVAIRSGNLHVCALLDDETAKCWGNNNVGQLGMASADDYFTPGRAIDAGAKIKELATGGLHTCAILENGVVKCWGDNVTGQLGLGDTVNRGNVPGATVASLPAVDLGGKAIAISAGTYHSCAVLEGGKVKCWGANKDGELGQGDDRPRGAKPNEMGTNLAAVDLGGVATAVVAANATSCAILEGGKVKCWGSNVYGVTGLGEPGGRGGRPNEMGTNLPALDLPAIASISSRENHVCATSTSGEVRCWGENSNGQLGYGDNKRRELVGSGTPALLLE